MNDMYTKEYQENLVYDLEQARTDILQWKAHILRSVNQDKAKQDIISNLNDSSALVVMDWAMKFLQMKYRERQSDWFAKRGISLHVSTVHPAMWKSKRTPTCLITASRTGSQSDLFLRIF